MRRAQGNEEETRSIDGVIMRSTANAIHFDAGDGPVWLPLSQVEISDDRKSILCPRWLAEEKGLV